LRDQITQLTTEVNTFSSANKKIRSSTGGSSVDLSGVDLEENGELKSAVLGRLIEFLYSSSDSVGVNQSTEYANIFLLTYRSVTTSKDVLETLLAAYIELSADLSNPDFTKSRLRSVLLIELYFTFF
jgi:hypothetical protein